VSVMPITEMEQAMKRKIVRLKTSSKPCLVPRRWNGFRIVIDAKPKAIDRSGEHRYCPGNKVWRVTRGSSERILRKMKLPLLHANSYYVCEHQIKFGVKHG
jgi:hypothetical protein